MRFHRAKMKSHRETTVAAEVVRASAAGEVRPMPSEDQVYFDESLRSAARQIGGLIRARRKVR
jgi:hypothetical protein